MDHSGARMKALGCTHTLSQTEDTTAHRLQPPSVWICVQISPGIRLPCLNCACCENSLSLSFCFFIFFSPPFLFSCAWRLSPRLNHPTTLDTNTRPSSKMPRHGINDKVTLAGAPAPPTLSWRLNCDKTPLFSPERRRRGYQKGGERGGGEKKKIREKATRGKKDGEMERGEKRERRRES